MKLINIIAAFILFINQCLYAQEPDPNSFFPYSVGNIWEYDMPYGEIARIEIIRDSIGKDGFVYLFYGSIFDPSWSIDTASSVVYFLPTRSNQQYYKLTADSGDTWMVEPEDTIPPGEHPRFEALVKNKYPSIVFGSPTVLMEIEYYELNWGDTVINDFSWKINTETLASGFGLILNWYEEPGGLNKLIRGCVIDGDTFGIITTVEEDTQSPKEFYISQNYPNPFNPMTNIRFRTSNFGFVALKVYDVLGNKIRTLVNEEKPAGEYQVTFNGSGLASGVYVYRIKTNGKIISKKMILLQ
ncbi:MAG: T9SS type A sorting domain-containing protein [Bacteroidetes bacterium]|nr:T9SS type A sorting domain-containing protein [Bacteroidota bacterium]